MVEYGVTQDGFSRKRLDEILQDKIANLKSILGENLNVSPDSPDGQYAGIHAQSDALLWEIAEASYHSYNPAVAKGDALSNIVRINFIERILPSPSTVRLTCTGTEGTVIPSGALVSSVGNEQIQFQTITQVVIGSGGSVEVNAVATVNGPQNAAPNTITAIDTSMTGWSSVTNDLAATPGTNLESDIELRARRERSTAKNSQGVVESVFAEVSAIDGVTNLKVLENDTNSTDANGLPAHNIHAIVVGGIDEDIAKAIKAKKSGGTPTFGNTSIPVTDSQGITYNIKFSRPTLVPIYVTVTINRFANYPANGDDQMKQAIVDYANGTLVVDREFSLGDDVIYSRLYTPINTIPNHEVTDLRIGVAPTPTGIANIVIAPDEISSFTIDNILVV